MRDETTCPISHLSVNESYRELDRGELLLCVFQSPERRKENSPWPFEERHLTGIGIAPCLRPPSLGSPSGIPMQKSDRVAGWRCFQGDFLWVQLAGLKPISVNLIAVCVPCPGGTVRW